MESLKAAIGRGDATSTTTINNETKGNEPISGVLGAGTADQPYDSGNIDDSHLTEPGVVATTHETSDVAAPLKSLADDENEAAPTGGILASVVSAVGLGGSHTTADTTANTTNMENEGREPVSGASGHETADQPYRVANEHGSPSSGRAHQLTSTNDGLQFVGGTTGINTENSHAGEAQSYTSITQAVNEGALDGSRDPAHSNDGLAFVPGGDKHPTEPLVQKTSNHAPVTGTTGVYTIGQPSRTAQEVDTGSPPEPKFFATNTSETEQLKSNTANSRDISNPAADGPDTTYNPEPLDKDGDKPVRTGPAFVSSLFCNPFAKREGVSGTSGEIDMDPKAKALPGSEPIPELQDHAVPVKVAKERRPLPTQSSAAQQPPASNKPESVVVEPKENGAVRLPNHLGADVPPGAASPKREKGKGKVYGDTDSTSTRSSLTRNGSITTSQTGTPTRDSRRFSSHTPGKIPTAGGIVLGEKASQDRERRASLALSGHSAATSEPQYTGRESLRKVTEDAERAPVTHQPATTSPQRATGTEQPPVSSPAQSEATQRAPGSLPAQAASTMTMPATGRAATPKNASLDEAPRTSTSGRVPGTEKGTLSSPPQAASRFSEQGVRNPSSPSAPAATPSTTERKPGLVTRIGRKLSIKSSFKAGRTSTSGAHPDTIAERK